jgi:transposase
VARRGLARTEKKALRDKATLVCVDESGFYLLAGLVRTYAPCGETPVLQCFETRDHVAVMSGITMTGHLYTLVRDEALTSTHSVTFLKHLLIFFHKVLVIWDRSSIHKGEVREYLAKGGAKRVHLEPLPGYAPELNPTEGLWQHLKHVELRNLCCANVAHLRQELHLALMRLRSKPQLVKAFFAGAGLRIES